MLSLAFAKVGRQVHRLGRHNTRAFAGGDYRKQFESLKTKAKSNTFKITPKTFVNQEEQLKQKFYEQAVKETKDKEEQLKSTFKHMNKDGKSFDFHDILKETKSLFSKGTIKSIFANLFKVSNPTTLLFLEGLQERYLSLSKTLKPLISKAFKYTSKININGGKLGKVKEKILSKTNTSSAQYFISHFSGLKESIKDKFKVDEEIRKERIELKKKNAQEEIKNRLTEKQIAELQAMIPEWKRTALTVVQVKEPKKSKIWGKVTESLTKSDIGKKFAESDSYKDIKTLKDNIEIIKDNLNTKLDLGANPILSATKEGFSNIISSSDQAKAIMKMKAYDPNFDFLSLPTEMEDIFSEYFIAQLSSDIEYLKYVCGEALFSLNEQIIKKRKAEVF